MATLVKGKAKKEMGVVPERLRILTEAEATAERRHGGWDSVTSEVVRTLYSEGYALVNVHHENPGSFAGRGRWIDGEWWPWLPWRLCQMVPACYRLGRYLYNYPLSENVASCWRVLRARKGGA